MLALLYVSALFAVVLSPVVRATSRVQIGRWKPFHGSMAILILLLAVAGALTAFGFFALPPVINDLQSLTGELPARLPGILEKIKAVPYADRIDADDVIAWIQRGLSGGAAYLLTSFKAWAGVLAEVIAGFVLTLYFILEGDGAYSWFLSFMPTVPRHRLDATLRRAAGRMEKWLLGQLSLMLILGTLSTIVYLSLGVRYAYVLGVLTGLLNLIPVLGAAVSLVLAMLVAAIDSWGRVLGVAIFFVIYLQIENYLADSAHHEEPRATAGASDLRRVAARLGDRRHCRSDGRDSDGGAGERAAGRVSRQEKRSVKQRRSQRSAADP